MCRSIMRLRDQDIPATDEEIRAAALQFVRKISGFRQPTKRHEEAFQRAVDEISRSSHELIHTVTETLHEHAA